MATSLETRKQFQKLQLCGGGKWAKWIQEWRNIILSIIYVQCNLNERIENLSFHRFSNFLPFTHYQSDIEPLSVSQETPLYSPRFWNTCEGSHNNFMQHYLALPSPCRTQHFVAVHCWRRIGSDGPGVLQGSLLTVLIFLLRNQNRALQKSRNSI